MKKTRFKGNKGFAASDALIAISIIALFSGLIASISYNIYLANSNIKRMSMANSYISEVFEYANKIYYEDVTEENLTEYFNNKYYYSEGKVPKQRAEAKIKETPDEKLNTPFKINLDITNYNETQGNTDKLDLVKQIKMTVDYNIGNKQQKIEMTTIKKRENLETPNIPNIANIKLNDKENVYPIKRISSGYIICNKNDNNWYNYQNGDLAKVIVTKSSLKEGDKISNENITLVGNIYLWIPRYAYTNNKIEFLFGNSDKYIETVNDYKKLTETNKNLYTIPTDFVSNQNNLDGVWVNNTNLSVYQILDNIYKIKD